MKGIAISCQTCNGKGKIRSWSFGVEEPDECKDCGGSGRNWEYPSGAVARYYSGPFLSGPKPANHTKGEE